MSANRGAWVGDRAFRCHETECPVFLFANNATVVAQEVLEEAVFFANHQSPIAAANEETRLRRVMLAPYGDWPNSRGLQRFQKPDAEEIVKEFSNVVNKLLNPASWLGLPWYEGHPDHPDFRGKPGHTRATAVGRIKSLEAGDDGLYANVKFNEDGERLISNESYHGHSVNWFLTRDPQGHGYRPFRLKSVGFTNEPNIPVPAVTLANAWSDAAREAALKARRVHEELSAHHFHDALSDPSNLTSARRYGVEAINHATQAFKETDHVKAATYHERAAKAHGHSANGFLNSGNTTIANKHWEAQDAHKELADFHRGQVKPSANSRFQAMSQMRWMANVGTSYVVANSSSRFRAMAQMREMANNKV